MVTIISSTSSIIPEDVKSIIDQAISHYPELQHTTIGFRLVTSTGKALMLAQPRISTLLRSKAQREYIIKINRELILEHHRIPITQIPRDVLIG